jgi:hypothetical protein
MNKFIKKTAVALATGSLVFGSFMPMALAELNLEISGNAGDTTNTVQVSSSSTNVVTQTNSANIENNVQISTNSGDNQANQNNGGDTAVSTGNATAAVSVNNNANSNSASVDNCGGCVNGINATVSGNASDTTNTVGVALSATTHLTQDNTADVENNVHVVANTGGNEANKNNGGDVSIETGNADVDDISVSTNVNANHAVVGGGDSNGGDLSLMIVGNAADSINTIGLNLANSTVVTQTNDADIENNIRVKAVTGYNEANQNNGGDTEIDTGDADVEVAVDNMANFNHAVLDDCCLADGTAKISGNGFGSTNTLGLNLLTATFATQDNTLECDEKDGCANVAIESLSGHNSANENNTEVDGDPSIDTGGADASVDVDNSANANGLSVGGDVVDEIEFEFPSDFPFESNGLLGWWMLLFGGTA